MADTPPRNRDISGIYRSTVGPLRRYLSRLLRDESEAEDLTHDAFMRVLPVLERDGAQKPAALLYTTARRLAINRIKRRNHAPVASDSLQLDRHAAMQPDVPQQVMARQDAERLEAAIAGLPEGCRAVLLLRKIELLSHKEIAARLGITVSTVEKQHARALRLLRTALSAAPGSTTNQEGAP